MFGRKRKEINELSVLKQVIDSMEKDGNSPEHLIRNIELIGKIVVILQRFQSEMTNQLAKS
tara:strand:- start:253 stop:435 length:183 start_codon:yes stop_codon:yes gene_type:complete